MSCLDEETIVAFIDARLAPEGIGRVEAHSRDCSSCRALLSAALAATPARSTMERLSPESTPALPDQRAEPTEASLTRGTSFGRYIVLGPLGRGAMGEVYAAYDPELDRKVAIKILRTSGPGPDVRSRSRLLREAKAIAKLRHPNVIVVHDAGSIGDRVFIAMEHVEGQTLAAWLADGDHTRKEVLEVFTAAARGLGAAHAAGLVHRDFKPHNVMVGTDGGVQVMDFGLAREIGAPDSQAGSETATTDAREALPPHEDPELPLTRTGELLGTPLYMAPEQFKAQRADARTDQFSFCVALYQALYGSHPFGGQKLGDLITAVTSGRVQPPPPKSAVPPRLRRILLRGLAVDPAARWDSMDTLTTALSRDPARLRLRWLGGAAVSAALVGGFLAMRAPRTAETLCRGGPARLAGVWEPDGAPNPATTRRAATRAAFMKTGVDNAADTWSRAARILDQYTADWLRTYGDTCAATHVRGEQSAEVLDLRMACLQERLGHVRALTEVFVDANATVLENAIAATGALPSLDRCADVKALRAVIPPPDDHASRAQVESIRHDIARVRALHDVGQCDAAAEAARKVISDADTLGYPPLQAEGLTAGNEGSASVCIGHEEMIRNGKRAVLLGIASHHYEAVADAAITVAWMKAESTSDIAGAHDWIDLATATIQGMNGSHPDLEALRLEALGRISAREGHIDKGVEDFERARALIEKTKGSESPAYGFMLNNIAVAYLDAKRYTEALSRLQHAKEVIIKVGGPRNTMLALCLANSAEALNGLHRYAEANAAAEESLRIGASTGASEALTAFALTMSGKALVDQERPREGAPRLEEALRKFPGEMINYKQVARFALARALWATPENRPRALALARDASVGFERFGNSAAEIAEIDDWLRNRGARQRGTKN